MQIKSIALSSPFVLAPLAGYTDLPFRLLCREHGAGLVYSEMISCHGLVYDQTKTLEMLASCEEERPVAIQLFGGDPVMMGDAAATLADRPIDIIDINMGCPVRKVIKKGAGAALMRDPDRAAHIIEQVCRQAKHPVSVKFRAGWDHRHKNAVEFAQMAESSGAAMVAVHARTWTDGFSGTVDWRIIADVKQAVSIPVLGNGDVLHYQDGLRMIAETGCDGVMIGRGALGRPWVFSPAPEPITATARAAIMRRHLQLIRRFNNDPGGLAKIKNHAGRYFKGLAGAANIRKLIYEAQSFQDIIDISIDFSRYTEKGDNAAHATTI